jgi:hypothetical protein
MPFSSVLGASSVIKPGVCTSTTRPSVPYTGQLIYETDTASVASWNGSAWVYTHSSGLVLVKSQTIGSAVSSVTVSNAFSATYDNYRIVVNGGTASAGDTELNLQLGAKTTGYKSSQNYQSLTSGSFTSAFKTNIMFLGRTGVSGNSAAGDIIAPNLTTNTALISFSVNNLYGIIGLSNTNDTTAYTDFTVLPASGTLTGGEIRVYGYKN